ncbi:MAG TPA: tetratricopeptide repeat protein [Bryobacteraceae bacterium]|nr:tetratricopeptide repeat protein [Bryobacteraceae bacterium]
MRAVENANRLVKEGKYDEATKMYQRAAQLNPRNGEVYYRLGLLDWELGRRSLESNLVRAVDLQPSNMDALEKLSELYLLSYRGHNDVRWRQRYVAEMEQRAAQMLQLDPRSPQGQRIKGYVAYFKADYAAATTLFTAALQAAPSAHYAAELTADKVSALLKLGRVQEAQSVANAYLAAQPAATQVYDALVRYYKESTQLDLALDMLRRKVAANPTNISAIFELASTYRTAGLEPEVERTLETIRSAPERFSNGYERLADFYARSSDYSRARQALRAGQAQQPNRKLDYLLKECELLVRQRRSAEAYQLLSSFGESLSLSAEQQIARQALLAQLDFPEGTDNAISELKSLESKAPRDSRIPVALARAFQKQNKVSEASSALDRAEFLAPGSADAHIARAQFFRSQQDFVKMRDAAERALALEPGSAEALLARGVAMTMLGQVPAALRDLSAVQKQWPEDPEVIHSIALLDVQQGRHKEAESGFKRAIGMGYLPSILSLAEMYTGQDRSEMALQILRPVMSASKVDPKIRMAHARAVIASGDYDSAIAELRQLVAQSPANPSISLELISALQRSGDNAGALAAARTASQTFPRNPEVLTRCADLILASGGNKAEAKSLLEVAIREQPDHSAGAKLACLILETGGDRTEALSLAQRFSRLNSDDPGVVSCIARVFSANGLSVQALRILEASVLKQPSSAGLRLELAQAYLSAGDKLKGRTELETAMRLSPTPDQVARLRAAFKGLGVTPADPVPH